MSEIFEVELITEGHELALEIDSSRSALIHVLAKTLQLALGVGTLPNRHLVILLEFLDVLAHLGDLVLGEDLFRLQVVDDGLETTYLVVVQVLQLGLALLALLTQLRLEQLVLLLEEANPLDVGCEPVVQTLELLFFAGPHVAETLSLLTTKVLQILFTHVNTTRPISVVHRS